MEKISKFELAKIIGVRAVQISKGAPPMVEIGDMTSAMDIAVAEYEQKVIPFLLIRKFPDGTSVEVNPNEEMYRVGAPTAN